jgi:uncharacterized protein
MIETILSTLGKFRARFLRYYMNQILLAFITGLTTGGISCIAVQGGLLASSLPTDTDQSSKTKSTAIFLMSKFLAYTALGAGLGALGSVLILSTALQGWMQIAAGIFMVLTSLKIFGVFSRLPVSFSPPKIFYRLIRNQSKSQNEFAPVILGAMTVLIPCGVTQATMALAVAQGNALEGAAIMGAFTLGTSPYFFAIGAITEQLLKRKALATVAACVVLFLGLTAINTGQTLRGSVHTWQNYSLAAGELFGSTKVLSAANIDNEGVQEVTINVRSNGYTSNTNAIKKGVPVRLTLSSENTQGCAQAFTIPSLNISTIVPTTGTKVIEFTPTESGRLSYSCSMGMYSGFLEVI